MLRTLPSTRRALALVTRRHQSQSMMPSMKKPVKVANRTVPAAAPSGPDSVTTLSNMFDRGPNVGVEIITKHGFVLSNNVKIEQPLVLLNGSAFLWKAPEDMWHLDALSIFDVIKPKPEIILFGTGQTFALMPAHVREHFYKRGIQVDQMNTKHAAATYNVLAEEGRRVAAVLLPAQHKYA